jgi:hypothetical protein
MEYQAVLLTTIEVTAVFIGFIVIFLTFVMGGQDRGKADRMHARALMTAAYPLVFLPLVPLIFHAYGWSEAAAWRMFNIAGATAGLANGAVMSWFYSRLNREELREVGHVHSVTSFGTGFTSFGFFLAGALGYAPIGNALAGIFFLFILITTSLFSFAAQQMKLFDFRNP